MTGAAVIGRTVIVGILSVLAAHALTFLLAAVLPDPGVLALGLQSVQRPVLSAFHQQVASRDFVEVLTDLSRGDLGQSLDGTAVSMELGAALTASIPRVAIAFGGVLLTVLVVAFLPQPGAPAVVYPLTLLSFMPPYVAPFLCLVLALSLNLALGTEVLGWGWWLCTLAIAVPSSVLAGAQAAQVMSRILDEPYAATVLAAGATPLRQRRRLLHNFTVEVAPTLEKMLTAMVAATLFAEPILGQTGLGTMTVRAIRRTDVDLLLAAVLVFAAVVNTARVVGVATRALYRVPQ